jgi:hypothetical protein
MDTVKEKNMLEELWNSGKAPWKIWDPPLGRARHRVASAGPPR